MNLINVVDLLENIKKYFSILDYFYGNLQYDF